LLLGDFNLSKEEFSSLASSFNLTHHLPTSPDFASRLGSNGQKSFIDHIASTGFPEVLQVDNDLRVSDHRLIWSQFTLDKPTEAIPRITKHVLKPLNEKQQKRILFHRQWPLKPYVRIARGLGMTKPVLETSN
jgi:hypothetical protein